MKFQSLVTIPGTFVFIPFTNLIVSSAIFGLIQIDALIKQIELAVLKSTDREVEQELTNCVKFHHRLMK